MPLHTYAYPQIIAKIVCSDLDETFFPFSPDDRPSSGIRELEAFLANAVNRHSLIFGIITGSNLQSTLRKLTGYANYYPHFIASSIGTELHWIKNNEVFESTTWLEQIDNAGYSKETTLKLVAQLADLGIKMDFQPDDYQGRFKTSLYYYDQGNWMNDQQVVQSLAVKNHIKVLFTRCNPGCGDPENCFDVEFIPTCCGKGEVVDFLMNEYRVSADNVYCFGDSFNDFSMFERTPNSFLVANADFFAKLKHPFVLPQSYCYGIKDKLEELL